MAAAAPGPHSGAREVLAVRYGRRVTSRAESYLNFHLYGEPDAPLDIDYFFWVIREPGGAVTLVDTGFAPETGDRRRRAHWATPADALPGLGIAPDDVTTVVISHAHWDHIGNLGQLPRAAIVMAEAEYAFWTSPMATRAQFAAHAEPQEIALLATARAEGRITLFTGQHALAPGVDLIEVGGHTPGQLIATVSTGTRARSAGTVVLASDALHFYEEVERDRPFAILADLPGMYRAYDTLAQLASQPGTHLVAGHDPAVRARFEPWSSPSGADGELQVTDLSRPVAR
ncbi:N-acyl homoserine lactonase family protein [Trebonia kvetii]|uniref:N-acyl homoserine lactonase family protein n=1 Tax=Trebonia kvetii TaxID=2480626 RepID=A0A6P2BLE3_9ACTN|nr:N-acyl homoserine lactonase family protein [Trebonia kvetii]TVY99843.1 N-acyl homoserine lactonase family protein [Trebonia kvetii]